MATSRYTLMPDEFPPRPRTLPTAFLGGSLGPAMDKISQALMQMVSATVSPIRWAVLGTQLHRGIKAREQIVAWLGQQIAIRRERTTCCRSYVRQPRTLVRFCPLRPLS